jgi:hypothetical protein
MANICGKSMNELCDYLSIVIPDLDLSVIENIKKHKINGELFLQLTEEYMREIAPLLGDRIKLKRIISTALEPATPVSSSISTPSQIELSDASEVK